MTDEERAREIVQRHGRILPPERQMELGLAIWDAIQVSRADVREKCAKEVEALIHPDPSPFATSMMAALNTCLRDAAAAIRAMGDKP